MCSICSNTANTHLLIPVHEVHEPVVVVVVVGALWRIGGDHEVVGPQPVPLCVGVAEDAGLQQLVIAVPNACRSRQRGAVSPVHCVRSQRSLSVLCNASPGWPAPLQPSRQACETACDSCRGGNCFWSLQIALCRHQRLGLRKDH